MALAAYCGLQAQSTGTVLGKIIERRSATPMEYATVSLHELPSGAVASGCLTDSLGLFRFDGVTVGRRYYVECSYIGCRTEVSDTFKVEAGTPVDIGTIALSVETQFGEVVVEGRKPALVARLDRKVFDIGHDIMSNAGSASDLMQHIPSVDVDIDGNVSLRGSGNVTILINGKPSAMMGARTRGDALGQLSAASIERIEVITNPSAEYKPDGMSGIINIILKKDARRGASGSVSANLGSYGRQNAGVNLAFGGERVSVSGGYAFRKDRYDRSIIDDRVSPADIIKQTTNGVGRPVSHTFRFGMTVRAAESDAVEVSGSYNHRDFKRNERVESVTEDIPGGLTDYYFRDRDALARENMWEGAVRYSHRYGNANDWGVDYAYSSESEDEMNRYSTLRQEGAEKNNEWVWDANYLHAAKLYLNHNLSERVRIMAGYELEHLRAEQNFHVFDLVGEEFQPDRDRTNDFTHYRLLNSVYASAGMKLGVFGVLAGMRGEYASIRNDLHTLDRDMRQNSLNLYPTLHVSRLIGNDSELMLSYSMRVNRPEGSDMNPFAERINPLSLEAGNPNLKPEKINSIELGWTWRGNGAGPLTATLYYRHIADKITEVSRYVDSGILLTTKENLQSSQNAGMELIWSMSVNRWLDFNLNVNGYYSQIDASKLGFGRRRDTFSWSGLLNVDFRPLNHWMIQMNARYRSATLVPQGRRDADVRFNLGMKYDIPSLGVAVIASVTDLLDTYRKTYTLDTPELKQKVEKRRNPRIIYVGLSWQFGGLRKRNAPEPEYDEGL